MKRTLTPMVVLIASVGLAGLGGCRANPDNARDERTPQAQAQPGQTGAAGVQTDDRTITNKIQSTFYENSTIKTADINVSTDKGVVTLNGRVPSDEVRREAVQAASRIDGVTRVEDRLTVATTPAPAATSGQAPRQAPEQREAAGKPEQGVGEALSSGWVTAKIQSKFFTDQDVKGRNIDVDTTNGVVTLTGQVDSDRARQRAVEIARQTEGVRRVEDQLRVASASQPAATGGQPGQPTTAPAEGSATPAVPDEELVTRIQSKFFANPDLRNSDIDVSASDGVVKLGGDVTSDAQRQEAVSVARTTHGVQRVEDEIKVEARPAGTSGEVPPVAPGQVRQNPPGARSAGERVDDGWITMKVQSKYFLDDLVKAGNVDVTTVNGVVTLAGTVSSAEARQQAVRLARETNGVMRVDDRLTVSKR